MKKYLITYDLKKPGKNYSGLYAAIQTYPWWHYLSSTWIVKSSLTANELVNVLLPHIDGNDRLLVVKIDPSDSQGWLSQDAWEWINS